MGLTIHYDLNLPEKITKREAITKLETLRQFCLDRPFKSVSNEIIIRNGEDADFQKAKGKALEKGTFEKFQQQDDFYSLILATSRIDYRDSFMCFDQPKDLLKCNYHERVPPKCFMSFWVYYLFTYFVEQY